MPHVLIMPIIQSYTKTLSVCLSFFPFLCICRFVSLSLSLSVSPSLSHYLPLFSPCLCRSISYPLPPSFSLCLRITPCLSISAYVSIPMYCCLTLSFPPISLYLFVSPFAFYVTVSWCVRCLFQALLLKELHSNLLYQPKISGRSFAMFSHPLHRR